MTKKSLSAWLARVALTPVLVSQISADTFYDDGISDLSNLPNAPTPLSFTLGNNVVQGTTGKAGADTDIDFFSFTVPAGLALDSITVLPGTSASPGNPNNPVSFIAIVLGDTFGDTVPKTAATLLGWHHYSPNEIGTDILDDMGKGAGAIGFIPPLGPGQYSIWIQEGGAEVPYAFNFHIPDAGPGMVTTLGAFALTLFAGSRRRLA